MYRYGCVLSLLWLGVSACASDPGWSGQGARPFDEAKAYCEAQLVGTTNARSRELAREECMAAQGWRRPH
jgi:hypothetical protein